MIKVENLSKEFKISKKYPGFKGALRSFFSTEYTIKKAVDDISFEINDGEIVGYIGANGAGKSTTIKMMTGILTPSSGRIIVDGVIPYENREKNAKNIGVVFGQKTQLWWDLPVSETFPLLKDIYGVSDEDYEERMNYFKEILGLDEFFLSPVRTLSLGQRMRADLAAALIHNPKIIYLDEPTIGLDVVVKDKIRNLIKMLNKEKNTTIVITTHDMRDVEELCQNVVIIDKGKKIFHDRLTDIYSTYKNSVNICLLTDLEKISDKEMRIKKEFLSQCGITITNIDNDRQLVNVLVEEYERFEYKLNQITELLASQFAIYDMKILDTELERVIKKI